MRLIADISQKQYELINKLVQEGKFESIALFIAIAIENQIQLETSGSNNQIEVSSPGFSKKTDSNKTFNSSYHFNGLTTNPITLEIPGFNQLALGFPGIKEAEAWIWGQINKILPIKIGVRVLWKELQNNRSITLDEFANKAADVAASIGNAIRKFEIESKLLRSEKISAGLPKMGDEKSLTRYKAQFLAIRRKDEKLDGAMALLRFANIEISKNGNKHLIGLTEPGLQFAQIINPVMDSEDYTTSLSVEESKFYLNHVKNYVISEWNAIQWILNKIDSGINEREKLNEELESYTGSKWQASDAVINTQRAGVMARMYELGLIEKTMEGIFVKYSISDAGKLIIENI